MAAAPAWEDRLGRFLDVVLGGCAAVILFGLMLITFFDVVGREVFSAPLPGGFEVTELMMGALIFVALPVVSWHEEHVVIDLLDGITPRRLARPRQVVMNTISAVVVAIIAWQTWVLAVSLAAYKEVTEILQLPVAPILYLIATLSGIAALALACNAWRHLSGRISTRAGSSST